MAEQHEKALVPQIRFTGFTDPWEQRKLGEVASGFEYGLNAAASDFDGEKKYLRITDIDDQTREFRTDDLSSPDINNPIDDRYLLKEGDILFARTGASVGKTYLYKASDGKTYYAGFLIRAHVSDEADAGFIFQSTLTERYKQFVLLTSQRSGQPGINAQEYSDLLLPLPSLMEQRRIGAFFDRLDSLITLHQRKYDKLCVLKKSMLDKMFPKGGSLYPEIRFAGFTDPWEQRKLGEVASGFEYGLNAAASDFDGEKKYLRITDIDDQTREFRTDDLSSPDINNPIDDRYLLKEGDILFARTGASVGKTYLYKASDGKTYYAGFLIRAHVSDEADAGFIFQSTLTERYKQFVLLTSQRSGQPGINAQEYSDLLLPLPSLMEQRRIGAFFDRLDSLITLHQRKLELLRNIKKSMLDKMFV
ncbi:restriction endonuclease subunit S [Bifidobacterium adolescentis]|uniref:restriction endonuclease subunit S n=2 Tax=Bifidobacterium adolescentis TaxID=1680 RepID=UPI0034A2194F